MIFSCNILVVVATSFYLLLQAAAMCTTKLESITCPSVSVAPTLDGESSDWSSVESFESSLTGALTGAEYTDGILKIQCVYDTERVYFFFEYPGRYRFDNSTHHKCASISVMFKIGSDAMLYNMGNCPLAKNSCSSDISDCDGYMVDIGHFRINNLENDIKNEHSVSPLCRIHDEANGWEGAWTHSAMGGDFTATNTTNVGAYMFEMSRPLTTLSENDAQLKAGDDIGFSVAVWDPRENDSNGWNDADHYVTGCAADWIILRLMDRGGNVDVDSRTENSSGGESSVAFCSPAGMKCVETFAIALGVLAISIVSFVKVVGQTRLSYFHPWR